MADQQMGFRNRSVNQARFAMTPRADIPRSVFVTEFTHKTTFDAGLLIPVYLQEILPGDSFKVSMTGFARMSTPVFPVMDNFHMDSFFFFVPNRLVWDNWVRMMGERRDPDDPIDYTVPVMNFLEPPTVTSVFDYLGLPTAGQITTVSDGFTPSAIPMRGLRLIYNEWFRDQNLIDSLPVDTDDGPDEYQGDEAPIRRGKRHDYFTSALPWPQKGDAVSLPLGTTAPLVSTGTGEPTFWRGGVSTVSPLLNNSGTVGVVTTDGALQWADPALEVDLSSATAATINAIRNAFQVQRLLERDARGGTRYTELLLSHFGVQSPDARLQRPEYLGGGTTPVNINPIAQTSATGADPGDSPLGALGAVGTSVARHGFSSSFTEHGYVIGLVNVRADLTYQQGLARHWSRQTRYDYYWPVFAHLGEQAVLRKEIYATGVATNDETVFGYQERWAEYRYHPSQVSGYFRSSAAGNIDEWHAAQAFGTPPVLNQVFIEENPPMARILAAGEAAAGMQFLFDSVFSVRMTRAMPVYSVPGFIDRF